MSVLVCAMALALLGAMPAPVPHEGRLLFSAAPERFDARVGEWVAYQMEGGPQQGFMRLAAVAEQKDAQGRDAVWVELEFGRQSEFKAPLAQFLMLVARETGLRTEGISRLFVTQGYEKPQEVDASALPSFLGPASKAAPRAAVPPSASPDASVSRGQPTRLMTLAGTVTAEPLEVRHRQLVIKRYWVSQEIPLLHLAKLEFPPIQYAMEVRDHGVDARPRMRLPSPGDTKIKLEPAQRLPARFQPLLQSDTASESSGEPP